MPPSARGTTVRLAMAPEGLFYRPDLIGPEEEEELVRRIEPLPLKEFEFRGHLGRRRTVSFGWRYDFSGRGLQPADELPDFLRELRRKAAAFAQMRDEDLTQTTVIEYTPGAAIGWHRDRPVFGDVVGFSLLSECVFRFRRESGSGWERYSMTPEPRSAYLLRGPARTEWEHSIAGVPALRYAVTFRSLRPDPAARSKPRRR